jgi:hypothetical protein
MRIAFSRLTNKKQTRNNDKEHTSKEVKKVQSDQYARVPKPGRMLALFYPVISLVEL